MDRGRRARYKTLMATDEEIEAAKAAIEEYRCTDACDNPTGCFCYEDAARALAAAERVRAASVCVRAETRGKRAEQQPSSSRSVD